MLAADIIWGLVMATVEERDLFTREVLAPIGASAGQLADKKLAGFLAMEGHLYRNELMVVGRAVNGWGSDIVPSKLARPVEAAAVADEVMSSVNGAGPCPMTWVTDHWGNPRPKYNTATSAFWRVIREVTDRLDIADTEKPSWPSHLVWSNLYKVSPNPLGNPSAALCRIQLPGCLELMELETSIYRPRRLFMLTGKDWAGPFLERLGFVPFASSEFRWVEAAGETADHAPNEPARVVVAAHPQGKPQEEWVGEVMAAFQQ
ncbi:MAG: hypothetical protein IBX63_09120 [Coriobacteriia bacterium]|nr:hypothetical protein [Coriobacteriia bacterium]